MSNWAKLKDSIITDSKKRKIDDLSSVRPKKHTKRNGTRNPREKRIATEPAGAPKLAEAPVTASKGLETMVIDAKSSQIGRFLALDCEMVGTNGPPVSDREHSSLARVSITNFYGHIIYDSYVKPPYGHEITDYRTWISGIKPHHLHQAPVFEHVQDQVKALIKGRIVVGHALVNDFKALKFKHPRVLTRDTQNFPLFRLYSNGGSPSLKKVAQAELGIDIQGAEHSSVEDARACMALYRKHKKEFEHRAQSK